MFAALGLALSEHASAREALLRALEREETPLTRAAIAQGLGHLGDERDAGTLVEELVGVKNPELQVQLAAALGFHGSPAAVTGLAGALEAKELSPAARAAAVQALGMLLDRHAPFALAVLSRNSNYSTFDEWMNLPLQSTL
jgi:HEAT repeat protein